MFWLLAAHTCVLLTPADSSSSAPSLCPAECHFPGNKDENKMLLDCKKPQGTVRYRPQITKHDTDAILHFNYDKVHITENLTT